MPSGEWERLGVEENVLRIEVQLGVLDFHVQIVYIIACDLFRTRQRLKDAQLIMNYVCGRETYLMY